MLTDTFIRGLGAFDGAFLQVVPSLSTLLQRGRDAIAGFGNPFTGHVRRCGEQGLRVVLQCLKFVSDSIFFHNGFPFGFMFRQRSFVGGSA
jgi:hypothetical protein